jgi:hypothetical protein
LDDVLAVELRGDGLVRKVDTARVEKEEAI